MGSKPFILNFCLVLFMGYRCESVSKNPQYQKNLLFIIGGRFHLGKYNRFRQERIIVYLLGVRKNIDYFRRVVTIVHLKVALRFYWDGIICGLLPKVLFFSQHSIVSLFLSESIRGSMAFLTSRWPAGIIGNWHTKVSVPFINYQLTFSYQLTKAEHNRYFKLFSGFKLLLGKPDLVVFLEFPGLIALKDCWLNGVPCIVVADSNSNSLYATYVIPSNCNGIVQCVILSLFLELLLYKDFLFLICF